MHAAKAIGAAIILLLAITITFSAALNFLPDPAGTGVPSGQSVAYYLKALNSRIASSAQTQGQPAQTQTSILISTPHISAQCIDSVLSKANSPAAETGKYFVQYGEQYGIDPGIALAFFQNESYFGKPGSLAAENKSIGNRKNLDSTYISYLSWEAGIESWYSYMDRHFIKDGKTTLEQIMPGYMPDNPDIAKEITDIKNYSQSYGSKC